MIKKILSVVLVLCFVVLNTEIVFASDDFADDFENEVLMEQLAKIKRRGIFSLLGDIGVHKEEVKLESFLNKKYRLFRYVIKNKSNKELFLDLNSFNAEQICENPKEIKKAKDELERIESLVGREERQVSIKPGEIAEFYHIATINKDDDWGVNYFQLYSKTKNGDYQKEAEFNY